MSDKSSTFRTNLFLCIRVLYDQALDLMLQYQQTEIFKALNDYYTYEKSCFT